MKALVVEDELTTRILVQAILSEFAEVDVCEDGKGAVAAFSGALARGTPYDLICMDIIMPVMSGIEALRLIREEEEVHGRSGSQSAKVIMTTVSGDEETIRRAFHERSDAYIVKPIDAAELIDIVHCLFPVEQSSV